MVPPGSEVAEVTVAGTALDVQADRARGTLGAGGEGGLVIGSRVVGAGLAVAVAALVLTLPPPPAVGGSTALCDDWLPTIVGTDGDDQLTGTGHRDVVLALGGADTVDGLGGGDVICGGDGDDIIDGGTGADVVVGQSGHDRLVGGDGDDRLDGGLSGFFVSEGEQPLPGTGPDDDVVLGGPGNDTVVDVTGSDTIRTGRGDDDSYVLVYGVLDLDGGPGADHFRVFENTATDVALRGGPGQDKLALRVRFEPPAVETVADLSTGAFTMGAVTAEVSGFRDLVLGIRWPLRLTGTERADRVVVVTHRASPPVTARLGAGDDRLVTGTGDDRVDGGPGRDRADLGPGHDTCVAVEVVSDCENPENPGTSS